jgi:hypothetical protein
MVASLGDLMMPNVMPQTPDMRRLEIEGDMSGSSFILWSLIGWGVALTVFFFSSFFNALLAAVLTVGVFKLLNDYRLSWRIPTEARLLADKAVLAFNEAYPKSIFRSAALRAIEVDRYVYSIRYDDPNQTSRPGSRRYFAVTRETDPVVVELDQSDWWPRGLK